MHCFSGCALAIIGAFLFVSFSRAVSEKQFMKIESTRKNTKSVDYISTVIVEARPNDYLILHIHN